MLLTVTSAVWVEGEGDDGRGLSGLFRAWPAPGLPPGAADRPPAPTVRLRRERLGGSSPRGPCCEAVEVALRFADEEATTDEHTADQDPARYGAASQRRRTHRLLVQWRATPGSRFANRTRGR